MNGYPFTQADETPELDALANDYGEMMEVLKELEAAHASQQKWFMRDNKTIAEMEWQSYETEVDYTRDIAEVKRNLAELEARMNQAAARETPHDDEHTTAKCPKCYGTGKFALGVLNGKPYSNTGFICWRCNGTGTAQH